MDVRKKKRADDAPAADEPTFLATPTKERSSGEDEYLEKLTESIVVAFALALVIKAGLFLRDYFLGK